MLPRNVRPIIFRSLDEEHPAFGVNPFPNPIACYIGSWDWGKYLGDEAIERGENGPPLVRDRSDDLWYERIVNR